MNIFSILREIALNEIKTFRIFGTDRDCQKIETLYRFSYGKNMNVSREHNKRFKRKSLVQHLLIINVKLVYLFKKKNY